MAKQTGKILRIGIIQGGRLIEERLIRKNQTVTIGDSPGATFLLPMAELPIPKLFPIFQWGKNGYQLVFTQEMKGKLTVDKQAVSLQDLVQSKKALRKGKLFHMNVGNSMRGKITVGEITLLFQFVVPPPVPPKAKLPASIRGGWFRNMDWFYMITFMFSFLLHAGFFGYCFTVPVPKGIALEKIDDRWAQFIVEKMPEPEQEKPEEKPTDNGEKVAAQKQEKNDDVTPEPDDRMDDEQRAAAEAKRKREIASKVENTALVKLIGALGAGGEGGSVIADALSEGGATGSIADTLDGVTSIGIATDNTTRGRRGTGDGGPQTKDIARAGIGGTGGGGRLSGSKEKAVKASSSVSGIDVDGELSAAAISKVIRRRQKSIQSCFEAELRRNPKLKGKVTFEIVIARTGKVKKAKVIRSSLKNSSAENCMVGKIKAWRFPKPDGGDVFTEFSAAFIAKR